MVSNVTACKRGFLCILLLVLFVGVWAGGSAVYAKTYSASFAVYDHADLLTNEEEAKLASLSAELGAERQTQFVVITLDGAGKDIVKYVQDFYDAEAPGYDKPHGNAAIIAIDLAVRDVYLAGFGTAEAYLDSGRLDRVRSQITPELSAGNYAQAFADFITISHRYMGYKPGVNPDNLLFKWWFQVAVSLIVAGVVVGIMAYNSGGRVTVNSRTYMDGQRSKVLGGHDRFIRQTVTKTKIPKSGGGSGGGGGGGITGGGFSHSGSRGKF